MWKILVPVDGSESALSAVRHAIKLAEGKSDAAVTLLYVHYTPVRYGAVAAQVTPAEIKEIERTSADAVLAEPEKLLRAANIRYEREMRVAVEIAPMIAKRAEELGSDTIVMGAHGGGALSKMLIGSTVTKVMHLTKLPVTVVR
jgi:nucleotide-binding universal stress UspA family protein